ncbi:hypothetical protein KPL70_017673 [Citrus sinensis]|nr:hypothetical protein KPL70_017673 [Citrus sinensis]
MAAKYEIEKFNGNNFSLWKMKIKAVLRKNNCLAAIGEKPMEITDDKWNEIDGNAISDLHLALADGVLSKSTMLNSHINTLKTLFSQLTTLGHNIEENERAELLLQSLPDSYDQLIIILTNNNPTNSLVFNDVVASILNEECRQKNKENRQANSQQAEVLSVTRGRSTEHGLSRSHNHGRSKSRRDDHALKNAGIGTIKIKMFNGTIRTIGEVRHVKGLKKNLLSLGQMDSHGYKTHVENGIMKIIKGALVLMKAEKIVFKEYKARVELESGKKIKCLRTDNGEEYTDDKFLAFSKIACYIVNRSPSTAIGLKTTMEMWTGKPANYSYLHVFGYPVYVMYNTQERTKLDSKFRRCIFLGYANGVNGYRLWDPTAHKIVISRDVIFIEDQLQRKDRDDSTVKEKSETVLVYVENNPEDSNSSEAALEHEEQEPVESEAPEVHQPTRERRPPEEIEALHKNKTWELIPLPRGRKAIGNKWVYKIKRDGNDQVKRVVLAMRATFDLHLEQLDVKTTFLYGKLEEEIYMLQLEGFAEKGKENLVCRLNKSLYGLKQVSGYWYKRFDSFIMSFGYNRLSSDHCAYYNRFKDNDFIILLLFMDDMLVASPNKDRIQELKAQSVSEFEMKDLEPANKILWMQIRRDRNNRKIWLYQKNYLKKILRRFNMHDCNPIFTSLLVNFKLSSSICPINKAERKKMSRVSYESVMESLMFVMICTRPDIAQAVGAVSRYMANPSGEHWITVKRILRYIRGTSDVALCYGGSEFTVRGYVDSDFTGDLDKRKSTTGYVLHLREQLKIWLGPKRPPPESELDFVNEPQGWLIVRSRLKDPWFWKEHESEHYVECADKSELATGTIGWCLTAPQAKFKLRVGFASGVGGEGWWVEICGCSLGFRDCSSFCSDMSSSQDEA